MDQQCILNKLLAEQVVCRLRFHLDFTQNRHCINYNVRDNNVILQPVQGSIVHYHSSIHRRKKLHSLCFYCVFHPPTVNQTILSHHILPQVEAPVSAPAYDQIQQERRRQEVLNAPPPLKSAPPARQRDDGGATTTTTKTFRIAVDIGDVQPQDVVVKTIDRRLIVTARHETKSPGRTSFSEFNREFDLPDNVDPNLVTASMTDDGKLLVEAPISTTAAAAVYGEGGEGAYTPPEGAIRQPRVTIEISK